MKAALLLVSLLFSSSIFSQSVVISGYFNEADPRDEWTELLVIADNTDMRGWTIRDNNSSQNGWQPAATFTNNALWNNLRAGTVIIIWHRPVSTSLAAHSTDVNKSDGYIEVDLSNATYFSGANLGTSPTWAGTTMNIAGSGELVQLRLANGTHVHALGHKSSVGSDWGSVPSPKLNHTTVPSNGEAIYVAPGAAVADYGTSSPQNGTTWTTKNSSNLTFGLPNISGSAPFANTAFWDTLRQPGFTDQNILPSSFVTGSPGTLSFSWTGAADPNAADGTTGYIVLRNTSNTFDDPADGTTYTTGSVIGTATVIAQINASGTSSYTDNTVMNGNSYYYRVYAYRFGTDNLNGNFFHRARGRAYSETFVFVDWPMAGPLPVELTAFSAEKQEEHVLVSWTTASELNNDYFAVERADFAGDFSEIGRANGNGSCTETHWYSFTDEAPVSGVNYYRLRQVDFNGATEYSSIVAVNFEGLQNAFSATAFIAQDELQFTVSGNFPVSFLAVDAAGRIIVSRELQPGAGNLPVSEWPAGIYFLRFSNGVETKLVKILR